MFKAIDFVYVFQKINLILMFRTNEALLIIIQIILEQHAHCTLPI